MELYKSKFSDRKSKRKPNQEKKSFRSFRNSRNDQKREFSTVTCADCGTECEIPFVPKTDRPVYCSDCFRQNKPEDSSRRNFRNDRESRSSRNENRGKPTAANCADCGTEFELPFVPRFDRPVFCSDCFRQNKPGRMDREDDSRFSRNEKSSRYSSDVDFRKKPKSKKLKNDKFLKKQESFYSNGSEKFYENLKDKLFEILGGKVCSSCGFRDERALGFSHLYDDEAFDSIRRGGFASSWGKYISEPELAREELKVLCLNCNEIREPVSKPKEQRSKPKEQRSKPKRKKSRYFPR